MAKRPRKTRASAGHMLGQMIGNWFEEYFVLPMLLEVAESLQLYLDHRFKKRAARGSKLLWRDQDGNAVDYDFVLELGGSDSEIGVPVAFIEGCWRRGLRHSKDKARDDTGKLIPMREMYPTARFLGVVVGGDFSAPARELIRSREIDLLYIPKDKIVSAFQKSGLTVDYLDRSSEKAKRALGRDFGQGFTGHIKVEIVNNLKELLGGAIVSGYVSSVHSALAALPQEIRLFEVRASAPRTFESIADASTFLQNPTFDFAKFGQGYRYEITFRDGSDFSREVATINEVRALHAQIERLATHLLSLEEKH
jgi:hypothetical protein